MGTEAFVSLITHMWRRGLERNMLFYSERGQIDQGEQGRQRALGRRKNGENEEEKRKRRRGRYQVNKDREVPLG
jgi:hypothetical protein